MNEIISRGQPLPQPPPLLGEGANSPSLLGKGLGVRFFALAALLALALAVGAMPITDWASTIAVYAQAGGYDLTWNTVDGGGVTFASGAGGYTLGGTAGQPDAAVWTGTSGYTLYGGFWHAAAAGGEPGVYLPIIMRH